MRFAAQYLWDHRNIILLEILSAGIFAGVFYLYHLPLSAVLYPTALCAMLGLLFAAVSVRKAYAQHRRLEEMQYVSEESLSELCAENRSIKDKDYQRLIRELCRERQRVQDETAQARENIFQYFTLWVHQIKTPISSMRLQLGTEDSALARRLRSELLRIEQYVEMVLTYLKMGAESTDYVFREVCLDKIIRESIRKFRGDFIIKRLRLVYEPVEDTVLSDEKWLSFVIEQVLSNALKYTKEGSVRICMEKPATLCVADTGIGIAPEDIPRIFEQGFTGENGRGDKRASGIGLYFCQEICRRLGHRITISSAVDEGTTVRIDLGQDGEGLYRNG